MIWRHRTRTCAVLLAGLALQGCGWGLFTSRESDPMIEDYIQTGMTRTSELAVLSGTASRRAIVMRLKDSPSGKAGVVCLVAPPPDVGEAFARLYSLEAGKQASHEATFGEGFGAKGQTGLNAAAVSAVSTSITPLLHRSQGIQFYRDGLYALCQDLMNNAITAQDYSLRHHELMMTAKELVLAELSIIGTWKPALPSGTSGPTLTAKGASQAEKAK